MRIIRRLALRLFAPRPDYVPCASQGPEVWCRPATVLALRDRRLAGRCLAGWR